MTRHRKGFRSWLAVGAVIAAGCAASLNARWYQPRGVDLRQYHSYAWLAAAPAATGDPRLDNNSFFDERVRTQVEAQLARRGFTKSPSSAGDLAVHYHVNLAQRVDSVSLDRDHGYCKTADCRAYVYDVGTLVIDFIDPRTDTLVWRGWAEGSFEPFVDNQAWMEKRVDEAVARILERLPATP